MKYSDIDVFCCPNCRNSLKIIGIRESDKDSGEVLGGTVACINCNSAYPIIKSIPRFVNQDTYASSFGYQWKKFSRTQFEKRQRQDAESRFYITTNWPKDLRGRVILEAGCGAGQFSGIALDTGAEVYSFDVTEAVEVTLNNIASSNLRAHHHLFQADIYKIPLPYGMFDKIFCLGVLQHCPDVKKAYLSLVPFLKPGGELVVDCYLSQPLKDIFNLKYLLRPFFKWWKASWLFLFCRVAISVAYDIKSLFAKVPLVGEFISGLVPIGPLNYGPDYQFSVPEIKEIKTLSMFDMLSPKYDKPQRISTFRKWMEGAGLEILELTTGYNGINARVRRKI